MKLFGESRREMERASSSGLELRHGGCLGHLTSVNRRTGVLAVFSSELAESVRLGKNCIRRSTKHNLQSVI